MIHGIHVIGARRRAARARPATTVVSCPTTEGNLGDGYLPAMTYRDAGVPLAIGSDSQVRIDPFEEARELETRRGASASSRSGLLAATGDLWRELCANGCRSLGLPDDLGGQRATVQLRPRTPRPARDRSGRLRLAPW